MIQNLNEIFSTLKTENVNLSNIINGGIYDEKYIKQQKLIIQLIEILDKLSEIYKPNSNDNFKKVKKT